MHPYKKQLSNTYYPVENWGLEMRIAFCPDYIQNSKIANNTDVLVTQQTKYRLIYFDAFGVWVFCAIPDYKTMDPPNYIPKC